MIGKALRLMGVFLICSGVTLHLASSENNSASQPAQVWVSEIRGTINPGSSDYLISSIHAAERAGAQALIVELDTPGGLVSSVREMAQAIDHSKVPVVVYVTPAGASATSAGALLALASHVAAMAPGSAIGAAHPVDSSGKDIPGAMGEKAVNDTAAFARGLAELRGRNRELAEQVVSKSRSLTAQEALAQKLVEVIAVDRSELIQKLDGKQVLGKTIQSKDAQVRTVEMTWGQKLLHLVANPNIATILMTLGMLCIYVEISSPGISIPGILGVVMLLVAFMSFQMLPIRTGGLLLLGLGVAMMIAEPFVATHGALAVGGVLSFVLGLLWVMDPSKSGIHILPMVWIPSAIGLGTGAILVAWAASRTHRLVKQARQEMGGGGALGLAGYLGEVESVSTDGLAGKALFRGELWDFESSESVKRGDSVEVQKAEGMKAWVRPARRS